MFYRNKPKALFSSLTGVQVRAGRQILAGRDAQPGIRSGRVVVFIQNRDFLGAHIVHLPLLHALGTVFSQVLVFAPYPSARLFQELGVAARVIVYRRGLLRLWLRLRRLKPDGIISLRETSAWLSVTIALSRAPVRVGFTTLLNRLCFTYTMARDTRIYRALNYLNLLKAFSIQTSMEAAVRALAAFGTDPRSYGDVSSYSHRPCATWPDDQTWYCLLPGGGAGSFKRWGLKNFLALSEALILRDPQAGFIFILGPKERRYIELIQASSLGARSRLVINQSLSCCTRAILKAKVTVANDCGPSHLAQLLGGPYVGLFSDFDGRVKERITEWFYPRPRAIALSSAPYASIQNLAVSRVLAAVERVLA